MIAATGEPAFSFRKKSATEAKAKPLPSATMFPRKPAVVKKEEGDADERDRDHEPVDPRSALAEVTAADERDVNGGGVLQEDGVGRRRHARGENEKHHREGVADRAADLRA